MEELKFLLKDLNQANKECFDLMRSEKKVTKIDREFLFKERELCQKKILDFLKSQMETNEISLLKEALEISGAYLGI